MTPPRPQEIKATHLARIAVIYVRQSKPGQVELNTGSTEYQRAQRQLAEAWGWLPEAIKVIESDLGVTGRAVAHRGGYLSLVAEIKAGRVGAVFASNHSRIGRNFTEWLEFIDECMRFEIVIVNDGHVIDLAHQGSLFSTRILALVAEYDNAARREHIRQGIAGRVGAGKAVTVPPVGYVSVAGEWEMDPDARVRDAIHALFRAFRDQRSCAKTVKELKRIGMTLPRKPPGRPVRWVEPNVGVVRHFLKNPRYTGRYIYREHVVDPLLGYDSRGQPRLRRGRSDETVIIENHHSGYVTDSEWQEIQAILRLRAPAPERRNLGPGSALLQGIVRCRRHGSRAMSVGYRVRRDGTRRHYYFCYGDYRLGGAQCGNIPGRQLDEAVMGPMLGRVSPPSLEVVRALWKQAKATEVEGRYLTQSLLIQARQRLNDADRRYRLVDPANRLVAQDLETKLEAAMCEVKRLEADVEAGRAEPVALTSGAFDELLDLAADVDRLFWAPTTTNEERKEIVRSLVKWVIVEDRVPGRVDATVVWEDQSPESFVTAETGHRGRQARKADAQVSIDAGTLRQGSG